MPSSLLDHKTAKRFDAIAGKRAKIDMKAQKLADEFMCGMSSNTINQVLDIVSEYGHPNERIYANNLRNKYTSGQTFNMDDIMTLDALYRSNCQYFKNQNNKVDNDE